MKAIYYLFNFFSFGTKVDSNCAFCSLFLDVDYRKMTDEIVSTRSRW